MANEPMQESGPVSEAPSGSEPESGETQETQETQQSAGDESEEKKESVDEPVSKAEEPSPGEMLSAGFGKVVQSMEDLGSNGSRKAVAQQSLRTAETQVTVAQERITEVGEEEARFKTGGSSAITTLITQLQEVQRTYFS